MEKIVVKNDCCLGCGLCVNDNPDYFEFDDMGLSKVIKEEIKEEDKARILDSIEKCPVEAIIIEEEKVA